MGEWSVQRHVLLDWDTYRDLQVLASHNLSCQRNCIQLTCMHAHGGMWAGFSLHNMESICMICKYDLRVCQHAKVLGCMPSLCNELWDSYDQESCCRSAVRLHSAHFSCDSLEGFVECPNLLLGRHGGHLFLTCFRLCCNPRQVPHACPLCYS